MQFGGDGQSQRIAREALAQATHPEIIRSFADKEVGECWVREYQPEAA
jgi:hypothetical protein